MTSDKVTFEHRLKEKVAEVQGWGVERSRQRGSKQAAAGVCPSSWRGSATGHQETVGRSPGGRAEGRARTSERERDLQGITGYSQDVAFHPE